MCVACHFPSRSSTSCLIHTEYFTLYCLGASYPSNHKAPHNMKCSTLSAPKWLLSSAEYVNLGRRRQNPTSVVSNKACHHPRDGRLHRFHITSRILFKLRFKVRVRKLFAVYAQHSSGFNAQFHPSSVRQRK